MEQLSVFKTLTPYRSVLFSGFAFYFTHILQQCQARDLNLPLTMVDDKILSNDCLQEIEFSNLKHMLDYAITFNTELTDLKPAILHNVADRSMESSLSKALMHDYSSSDEKQKTNDANSYDYFDEDNNSWLVVTGAGLAGAAMFTLNSGDDSDSSVAVSPSLSPTTVTTTTASVNQIKMVSGNSSTPSFIVSTDQGLSYTTANTSFSEFQTSQVLSADNLQTTTIGSDVYAVGSTGADVNLTKYTLSEDNLEANGSITLPSLATTATYESINLFQIPSANGTSNQKILSIKPDTSGASASVFSLSVDEGNLVSAQLLPLGGVFGNIGLGQLGTFNATDSFGSQGAVSFTNYAGNTFLMSADEGVFAELFTTNTPSSSWLVAPGVDSIQLPSNLEGSLEGAVSLTDNLLVSMNMPSNTNQLINVDFANMTVENIISSSSLSQIFPLDLNSNGDNDMAVVYDGDLRNLHIFNASDDGSLAHRHTDVASLYDKPFDQLTGLDALNDGDGLNFVAALQDGGNTTIVAEQLSFGMIEALDSLFQ